jgi:hypothetical protein
MGGAPEMPKLTLDDFSPHLNKDFTVRGRTGASSSLTLVSADAVKVADPATIWTPPEGQKMIPLPDNIAKVVANAPSSIRDGGAFSLYFSGSRGDPLPAGIYALDHPTLGKVDIFLNPAPKDGQPGYSAAFS